MTTSPDVERPDLNTADQVAERLIAGSLRRSFNSLVDVDWDAPQDPDRFYLPPESLSLYGTELWEQMSHRERVDYSREEAANLLTRGVWFENTLNQGLLRAMLHQDPTARHVHYSLTEVGDETRHMIMFGRTIEAIGTRPYRLSTLQAMAVQLLPIAYRGTMLYVAALCGEEVLDDLQRKLAHYPDLQPIMQQVMQIHVTEEARHIRFAREAVRRRVRDASLLDRTFAASANGAAGFILAHLFQDKEVYRRCGLDPNEAMRQAKANELVNAPRRESFESLHAFLDEVGLINPVSRFLWRRFGFLK
jgi:hypothetical protein